MRASSARYLSKQFPTAGKVVGFDLSPHMVIAGRFMAGEDQARALCCALCVRQGQPYGLLFIAWCELCTVTDTTTEYLVVILAARTNLASILLPLEKDSSQRYNIAFFSRSGHYKPKKFIHVRTCEIRCIALVLRDLFVFSTIFMRTIR